MRSSSLSAFEGLQRTMRRFSWWKNKRLADIAWSERLSVGNALLDSEHRNLIAKINDIMHMIDAGDVAALPDSFERLEAWLIAHHENEWMFAQSIGFDSKQHSFAHLRSLNELQYLRGWLAAKNWAISDGEAEPYYQFLHDWFIRHIQDCMQMKPVLHSRPYDYVPSGSSSVIVGVNLGL